MRGNGTVVINGQHYDAATGLMVPQKAQPQVGNDFAKPVSKLAAARHHPKAAHAPAAKKEVHHRAPAATMHGSTQRSQTLARSAVKKPVSAHPVSNHRQHSHVAKSPHITRFAPHPQPIKKTLDVAAPKNHSVAVRHPAAQPHRASMPTKQISSRAIKEHLVAKHLQAAQPASPLAEAPSKPASPRSRKFSLATAGLALVMLGGYLTYLNMPAVSIRVAAAQAGIEATLPEYNPDGYRFNGPVAFSQGKVDISYASNGGSGEYRVSQQASDWDSQAVLDNFVLQEATNGDYSIRSTQGLTIYSFNNKAAWVNNGMLHVIEYESAPLSFGQIERIAASM